MQLTFDDAIEYCALYGHGSLTSISSTEENNFIASHVLNTLYINKIIIYHVVT